MRKKKVLLPILILVFLLQLLAPIGLITYQTALEKNILQHGTDYKFKVDIHQIQDGTVQYRLQGFYYFDSRAPYASIVTASDGFSELYYPGTATKPKDMPYLYIPSQKSFPNPDLEISTASEIRYRNSYGRYTEWLFENETVYALVRVYQGHSTVLGLYVNGTPLDDWLAAQDLPQSF